MGQKRRNESPVARDRVRAGLGELLQRATTRAGEGAGRLRGVARDLLRSPLLPQALAARERGNLEAAFWLLDEAHREHPHAPEVAAAFWDVSLALDRAPVAASAAVALVEGRATEGAFELANQYLAELAEAAPGALVQPTAVARMLPALRERVNKAEEVERDEAVSLLRHALDLALDPRNETPSPGLAFHLFAEARDLHPAAARRAAHIALESPDLHEAKRSQLSAFLGEPAAAADETAAEAAEVESDDRGPDGGGIGPDELVPDPLTDQEVAAAAGRLAARPATPPDAVVEPLSSPDREMFHAVPLEFDEDALVFQRPDGRGSRIGWREIQAVAVARIEAPDRDPVTVVDFVLNWTRRDRETLRFVRLLDENFDPARFVQSGDATLAGFLAEILERSRAIPLPDPESALGLRPVVFDALEAYEREVLGRDQPDPSAS